MIDVGRSSDGHPGHGRRARDRANPPTYEEFHRDRFDFLLQVLRREVPDPGAAVLDVGRGPFTSELVRHYPRTATLGLPLATTNVAQLATYPDAMAHHVFDLNRAGDRGAWPELPRFDVVVLAEVIEHLTTAPEHVLAFVHSVLRPGGMLIVQTPNAVALAARLKALLGRHPYERIRLGDDDPGHFREYTKAELVEIGRHAGFAPVSHHYRNYFAVAGSRSRALDVVTARTPSLQRGQTVVFRSDGGRAGR